MTCAIVSLFIHVTVDPTEMLIGFGVNPPLTIVAFTVVGVGAVGELPFPQATAAIRNITATVILIRMDMIISFRIRAVQGRGPIAGRQMSLIGGWFALRLAYEKQDLMAAAVSHPFEPGCCLSR
jgi:hypothetical protein